MIKRSKNPETDLNISVHTQATPVKRCRCLTLYFPSPILLILYFWLHVQCAVCLFSSSWMRSASVIVLADSESGFSAATKSRYSMKPSPSWSNISATFSISRREVGNSVENSKRKHKRTRQEAQILGPLGEQMSYTWVVNRLNEIFLSITNSTKFYLSSITVQTLWRKCITFASNLLSCFALESNLLYTRQANTAWQMQNQWTFTSKP